MDDFSQSGEQAIITRYFTGRHRGMLLSIGENDGETFSMSRALMLDGWRGVLVEPSPPAFQKLCSLYGDPGAGILSEVKLSNATLVRAAIITKNGPVDFYDSGTHLKKGDVALLSTTVPTEMDRWKKSGETFTKTVVRGITFQTLLKQLRMVPGNVMDYTDEIPGEIAKFDFISIDCEGADWDVLKQIDLSGVGCQMLCIEFNQSKGMEVLISSHCRKHGMKLIHRNFENLIWAR